MVDEQVASHQLVDEKLFHQEGRGIFGEECRDAFVLGGRRRGSGDGPRRDGLLVQSLLPTGHIFGEVERLLRNLGGLSRCLELSLTPERGVEPGLSHHDSLELRHCFSVHVFA